MTREVEKSKAGSFYRQLIRRKHIAKGDLNTKLRRCLNTFDLTLLGVGHMCGAGIFVTTGEVMRNWAGPSTILSYLVSGLAALLAALCYAEFGSRYPKAGSAYTYAYVGCGEIWAFIIGWNIILEQILSASATARTFSAYFGDLTSHAVDHFAIEHARVWPWSLIQAPNATSESHKICTEGVSNIAERSLVAYYPDLPSAGILLICALFVGLSSKMMSHVNNVFQSANLLVILGVVLYGITFANFENWKDFFPCGVNGVLTGASKCFFAYVGFDSLATAGEEARNPSKQIPRATYYSMGLVIVTYMLMACTLSLMLPYYQLTSAAVYSQAFHKVGAPRWFSVVLGIGAIFGIMTTILVSLFCLPRAVYAMAEDGLIFGWWARVNKKTKTPLNATITFTVLALVIAVAFDLDALVDFLSIGTLLAYSLVSAALLNLRYRPCPIGPEGKELDQGGRIREGIPLISDLLKNFHNGVMVAQITMIVAFFIIGISIATSFFNSTCGCIVIVIAVLISIACLILIDMHQQNSMELDYKVFLVPYIPAASLFVNIIMITQLTMMTWIRFGIWMAIGFAIYFFYGMRHSKEHLRYQQERAEMKTVC